MPVFNLTISNTSPAIVYGNGAWVDSTHADVLWYERANGTFHATADDVHLGATATLTFNGSAVFVIGSKRDNHGDYLAILDGQQTRGNSNGKDIFNSTHFSQTGLSSEQHELIMENQPSGSTVWFDIDYILVTSGDGNPDTPSIDVTLDDNAPNITYSSGWNTSLDGSKSNYFMQTIHRTNIQGALASILFYGNAITLYGTTSADHGLFSVTIDGIPHPYMLDGVAPVNTTRYQNMLYYSGGLVTSMHNVTVAHADPDNSKWFDLDRVVVSTWPEFRDITPSSSSSASAQSSGITSPPGAPDTSGRHRASPGEIAGYTTLGVVVIVLLVLGAIFVARKYIGKHRNVVGLSSNSPSTVHGQHTVEPFPTFRTETSQAREYDLPSSLVPEKPQRSPPLQMQSDVRPTSLAVTAESRSGTPPPGYDEAAAS